MQRARRLASVAVVATLAVSSLAACRSAPDVAVYFGQTAEFSVADVERVVDDARTKLTAARDVANQPGQEAAGPVEVPITGPDVVSAMVSRLLVTRIAQQHDVALPATLPLDEVGQSVGLPGNTEYVRLYAETRLLFNQLLQKATPVEASDADVRTIYDIFQSTGAMPPEMTFDQFRAGVSPEALATLGRAVAVRQDVRSQLDRLDVRVNPRFEPSGVDIYIETGPDNKPLPLVSVPLSGSDTSPVIDPA